MNSFSKCSDIEKQGLMDVIPFAKKKGVQIVQTGNQLYLQKVYGDIIAKVKGRLITVELKVERKQTGNLFLENWSNRKWLTPGWMMTCLADRLWYYFIENKTLYACDFERLKSWVLGLPTEQLREFERQQRAHDQKNDTWGWCVPVDELKKHAAEIDFNVHTL